MRTLLISIFFCSLAQLALADAIPEPWDGCGTKFTCYTPEKCSKRLNVLTIDESETKELKKDWTEAGKKVYPMKPNCEALIRVHAHASHWAFVSIESFDAAITSIEFYNEESKKQPNDPSNSFEFSCKKSEVPDNSGQWKLRGTYGPHRDSQNSEIENTYDPIPQMIKCEFSVLLSRKNMVFGDDLAKFRVQIKINGNEHTVYNSPQKPIIGCDSSLYKNGGESGKSELKVYRDVKYSFGEFSCDDPEIFKKEYRLDAITPTDPFIAVSEMKCTNEGKIDINTGSKTVDLAMDDLEIRCVADARYFCNEGVKNKPNKTALIHKKSSIKEPSKPSKLECPTGSPHLVIREDEKPIQYVNSKLECLARGSKQLWAIERKIFLDNNEAYYCTKDLECHLQLRIAENDVFNGDLDSKTFLPKCSMNGINGILFVKQEEGKKVEIDPPSCNLKTGQFEYKVKGGPKEVINNSTKFECTYPKEQDENMNMGAAQTAQYSAIAVGIAAAIGGGIIGIMIFLAERKRRRVKEKQRKQEQKEKETGHDVWIRYCMDDAEKEKIDAKMKKIGAEDIDNEVTPPAGDDVYNWNRMLMNFQRNGLEISGANKDGKILPTVKAVQTLVKIDVPKADAEECSKWLITKLVYNNKNQNRIVWKKQNNSYYTSGHEERCHIHDEIRQVNTKIINHPEKVYWKVNRKSLMKDAPAPPKPVGK